METIQNVFHQQIVGHWRRGVQFFERRLNRIQQQLRFSDGRADETDANNRDEPERNAPAFEDSNGRVAALGDPTCEASEMLAVEEAEGKMTKSRGRRKSVCAERYDPEKEEGNNEKLPFFPKTPEQRDRLAHAVKDIFMLKTLENDQLHNVLDAMRERKVTANEHVIKQGDDGDNFYVIDSGAYDVYIREDDGAEKCVAHYDNRGSFGELALMYNTTRTATVVAKTDGVLWALEYERSNVADALVSRVFSDGQQIIKQNDEPDGMYFIVDGTVRVTVNDEHGKEVPLSTLTTGQYFGELALVTHQRRCASIYAVGDVKVAFLDVTAFERLLGPCVELMKRNITLYEEQLSTILGSKAKIRR